MGHYIDADKLTKFEETLADAIVSSQGLWTYEACKNVAKREAPLLIASLQQGQPEVQNGKFVFPKYLYARTKDNKTIDMSYAPQDMTAVEYIRNDFVEQEQPEVDLEKEIKAEWDVIDPDLLLFEEFKAACYRIYELGLNARKEE